ncbi:MAG: hypothetical protein ABI597_04590 [Gammaproteobacteria bacterium]
MSRANKTRYRRQASNGSKQMSFLPEPDFNPKLPSKNTLSFQALYLMLQGRKISHLDFQSETHSYRLAVFIDDLNKLGWPIQKEDIKCSMGKKSKIRNMRLYFLDRKIIAKSKKILGGAHV